MEIITPIAIHIVAISIAIYLNWTLNNSIDRNGNKTLAIIFFCFVAIFAGCSILEHLIRDAFWNSESGQYISATIIGTYVIGAILVRNWQVKGYNKFIISNSIVALYGTNLPQYFKKDVFWDNGLGCCNRFRKEHTHFRANIIIHFRNPIQSKVQVSGRRDDQNTWKIMITDSFLKEFPKLTSEQFAILRNYCYDRVNEEFGRID